MTAPTAWRNEDKVSVLSFHSGCPPTPNAEPELSLEPCCLFYSLRTCTKFFFSNNNNHKNSMVFFATLLIA